MNVPTLISGAALALMMLASFAAQATPTTPPQRWVSVDDLRVRLGPSVEHRVSGTLLRGAELILKGAAIDDFCLIEGDGHYGYVGCKYLSAERVPRAKAGADGVDAAQRWVSGNGVTLRDGPRPDAAVVGRLSLNAVVKLLGNPSENGYCEVQATNGPAGYTACRYLAITPVVLVRLRGDTGDVQSSAEYNPERIFWLEPSWTALEQYAQHLQQRNPGTPQGPWPRNDTLERMKAHLALGLNGRKPEPYADWSDLKRKASQDLSAEKMMGLAHELQTAIGIWGPLHDAISAKGGAGRTIQLVRSLEFPKVQPSLFRSEAELAPPTANAEEASGRFNIVFRQIVTPRARPKANADDEARAGLYDMLARTRLLVKPVQKVTLFRDGRLRNESSLLRSKETLWHDVDEPMCSGWVAGFGYGDADARIWRYFGDDASDKGARNTARRESLQHNPAGSLYAFYTNITVPQGPATYTETSVKLDRAGTGFIQGTHLHYDLDRDGVPDIAVWEGQGKGPGHLEGVTTTDDRWYRLVLVNMGGKWKVLGSDVFGYGCGC